MSSILSVPSPLHQACNSTLYYYSDNNQLPSIAGLLNAPSIKEQLLSPLSRVTMQVCFLYFCRICEVLNATVNDVIYPDRVVLHGAKRSNSYVVYLPGISEQILQIEAPRGSLPLFPISYSKLYRDAVRIGINMHVSDSTSLRRLHAARYAFSKSSVNSIVGSELAGVLRHRSLRNYSFYLK